MDTILLYNNRTDLAQKIELILQSEGMRLLVANDVQILYEMTETESPDLLLLDTALNDKGWDDGIELISELRERLEIPLLVVSGQDACTAKIAALEAGADDYVTENCSPLVLFARIRSQLRRYRQIKGSTETRRRCFRVGELTLDDTARSVQKKERSIRLTPIEFDILKLFMSAPGEVFSSDSIFEKIWKMKPVGSDNTVAVHIRHLREKIEEDPGRPQYIRAVWGEGYRIATE